MMPTLYLKISSTTVPEFHGLRGIDPGGSAIDRPDTIWLIPLGDFSLRLDAFPHFEMAPRIYTSPVSGVPIVEKSLFTHLFSSPSDGIVGGFPSTTRAFVDANTGTTLTRGQLKHLALTMGFGLRDHPTIAARRNEVVLIYSQNSLNWPVALFGSGKCQINPSMR